MSIFTDVIGGNLGKLFKEVVGTFKLDPAKKAELEAAIDQNEHEIQLKEFELQVKAIDAENTLVSAQKEVVVAEMQQGDNYTKRARPTIVYCGLGFIALNYVLLPYIAFFTGFGPPKIELPSDFWYAWTGVVGIWSIGRTMEKKGNTSSIVQAITGAKK